MAERCIDANIAIKWFMKGEAFRQVELHHQTEIINGQIILARFLSVNYAGALRRKLKKQQGCL